MPKFPKIIHVTQEGEGNDKYFNVNEAGIASIDESGKTVAVYQLVEVGRVEITKTFKKDK